MFWTVSEESRLFDFVFQTGKLNTGSFSILQVPLKRIKKMVKEERLAGYVETSARRGGEDVDNVFHEAIRVVLQPETAKPRSFCSLM